jgi:hypothetical protein
MNKSLYNISDEYLQLMKDIEEVEGDLTLELEERLKINQEELESKIKAYHGIIKNNEGDLQLIKDEKERLSSLANTKENLIKRLKNKVLDTCTLFGYDDKSGNKKLDFDTLKCYTVNKDKIEVDEENFISSTNKALWDKEEKDEYKVYEYSLNIKLTHKQAVSLIHRENNEYDMSNFIPIINKTTIKEIIETGATVPHSQKINNPYITFR